ncbi:MAG: ABC-F family ATP-binding cassette domain-containing protein [Acidimicrobiia bacterium]|nr:MAG: ABC-F family ATP-binding cassette domain-containing protein [Acidimicrobiia bacterium]
MHLLSLESVTKSYPETPVLDRVSLGISSGERIGVIGRNGSGKSTLLRIIAGQEDLDAGGIVSARGLRISALKQNPGFNDAVSVGDVLGGDREAIAIADRLGLTDPDTTCGTLSGGQSKRLALAQTLAAECDLLILDEPTNHLDVDIIDWLEDHLGSRRESLLLVTHDRYLLDRVVNRVIEIHDHSLYAHQGTYEQYLEAAAARDATDAASEHKRQRRIKTELAWLRRSPKARTSKSRFRMNQAEELMSQQRRTVREELTIDLPSRRIGSKVVNLHNVGKKYDEQWVLRHVEYKLQPDARIGIVGPNGSGKTTLLQLIAQRIEPDEGKVSVGSTIHYGWYGQDPRPIAPGTRVQAAVREHLDEVRLESGIKVSGSQMLERFQFTRDQQQSTVGDLSGGERRRLELLLSLMEAPNLLLMDEPTNDLDIETLDVLEEYLDGWKGALVVSSHDRYFLDRVCTDLFSIEPNGSVLHHPGGWSQYRATQQGRAKASTAAAGSPSSARPQQRRTKLTYNDKRDLELIGRQIPKLEKQKISLTEALEQAADDYEKTLSLSQQLATTLDELDTAETRWLELTEHAEQLGTSTHSHE